MGYSPLKTDMKIIMFWHFYRLTEWFTVLQSLPNYGA